MLAIFFFVFYQLMFSRINIIHNLSIVFATILAYVCKIKADKKSAIVPEKL